MIAVDLTDPAFVADPYPVFAAARAAGSIAYDPAGGMWLALSWRHANQVLRDRGLGRIWRDREPADRFAPFNALHRHQMMENEPPRHTRLRAAVAREFARGHVERLRPVVAAAAQELLAAAGPEFDLIADFAEPLPVRVIADLLGVPEGDRTLLRPWSQAIVRMYEYHRSPDLEDAAVRAATEFADYMRELARARRTARTAGGAPGEDLLSQLVAAGELSEDELVASAILLLNAGHEASVNAFGNGVVALLRHPAELDRLRADPEGMAGTAIEEMLRYDAPLQLFERTARQDTQIGEVSVPAGRKIAALLGAANRDPAAFADPDRFDIGRDPNPHLAFGAGVHFCLGAPLARVELQVALATLIRHCPGLALAAEPVRRPTFVLRGYREVRVSG